MYTYKYSNDAIFWNNDSIDKPMNLDDRYIYPFPEGQNQNINFIDQYLIHFSCEEKDVTYIVVEGMGYKNVSYFFVNRIIAVNGNVYTYACELDTWMSYSRHFITFQNSAQEKSWAPLTYTNVNKEEYDVLEAIQKIPFSDDYRAITTQSEPIDFNWWDLYVDNYKKIYNYLYFKFPHYFSNKALKYFYNFITNAWESLEVKNGYLPPINRLDNTKFRENGLVYIYKINIGGVTNYFAIPQTSGIDFYPDSYGARGNVYFNEKDFLTRGLPKDAHYVGVMKGPKLIDFLLSTPPNAVKKPFVVGENPTAESFGTDYYVNFIYYSHLNFEEAGTDYYCAQGFNLNYFFNFDSNFNENNFFILNFMEEKKGGIQFFTLPSQMFYNDFYYFGTKTHPAFFTYQDKLDIPSTKRFFYDSTIPNPVPPLLAWGYKVNLSFNEYNFSIANRFIAIDFPKRFNDVTQDYAQYVNSTYNSYNTSLNILKQDKDALKWQNQFNGTMNSFTAAIGGGTKGYFAKNRKPGLIKGAINAASQIAENAASTEFTNQNLEREYNNSVNTLNASRADLARSDFGTVEGLGQENSVALNFVNNWFFCFSKPLYLGIYSQHGKLYGLPKFPIKTYITFTPLDKWDCIFLKYDPEYLRLACLSAKYNNYFPTLNKNFQAKILEDLIRGVRIWRENRIIIST